LTSFAALFHPDYLGFPAPQSEEAKTFDFASQTIVIVGAGSNVGKFGVQWAKVAGLGKIIVVASITHEQDLKAMGATHVVDRHSVEIVKEIQTIAGGKDSVTHIYDCVNWTYELATEMVSSTLPSRILALHEAQSAVELLEKMGKNNVKAEIVLGSRVNLMSIADMFWPYVGQWLKEGKIQIPKFRTIEGLDEAAVNEALDSYRDGKPVTQAIVHPWGKVEL
jgi:NADPH2:quinone reductase